MALPRIGEILLCEESILEEHNPKENLAALLDGCPKNTIITDNMIRAWKKINSTQYSNIVCSISGGSDSDIMLDICQKVDLDHKIRYIWFDTGLEYQATKDHLTYLEAKYGIAIKQLKAIKSIPLCCKEYGQPFLSKRVSDMMQRLQSHHFSWEDQEFETLLKKYPNCQTALMWWCNEWGEKSKFNISCNKWLKEFITKYPPKFAISGQCCNYTKKLVGQRARHSMGCDLSMIGIRKAEGGVRSSAYKTCFSEEKEWDEYRPLFWYTKDTKELYDQHFQIVHSKCYTEYGLSRTGCAGCPCSQNLELELNIIKKYEPKLYPAVNMVFRNSYIYTKKYKEFYKMMNGF